MKLVALYLMLVGVPLAGLAAILHAGRALRAPAAIGGAWRVESLVLAAGDTLESIALTQSGEHVEVELGAASLRGRFVGDSLVAARRGSPPVAPGTECAGAAVAGLRARVDSAATPMRLWGTLQPAAPGCAPVPFAAVHAGREAR